MTARLDLNRDQIDQIRRHARQQGFGLWTDYVQFRYNGKVYSGHRCQADPEVYMIAWCTVVFDRASQATLFRLREL